MFNISTPTVISQLASATSSKLTMFAANSLAKSKVQAQNNLEELAIWEQEQQDKLEARITKHLTRKTSSKAELAAIQLWREELAAKKSETPSE